MTRKVIVHPSSKKVMVKQIMDEVRAVKALRAICKELQGQVHYSPDVAAKVIEIKQRRGQ